ncbi:hypothetical protein LTR53_018489, partial [Teratosphaeriaceae sp. CCFEE 6253]
PARGYREAYSEMIAGIQMLYFVADAYREERVEGKGKRATVLPPYSAEELFAKYARDVLGKMDATAEGREAVERHVDFLFASMLAGKEGIEWVKNPLYIHLRRTFPEEHAAVVQRLAGPPQKPAQR